MKILILSLMFAGLATPFVFNEVANAKTIDEQQVLTTQMENIATNTEEVVPPCPENGSGLHDGTGSHSGEHGNENGLHDGTGNNSGEHGNENGPHDGTGNNSGEQGSENGPHNGSGYKGQSNN